MLIGFQTKLTAERMQEAEEELALVYKMKNELASANVAEMTQVAEFVNRTFERFNTVVRSLTTLEGKIKQFPSLEYYPMVCMCSHSCPQLSLLNFRLILLYYTLFHL